MQYRELGRSGVKVSVVALGLWQAGGGDAWGADFAEDDVIAAIRSAPEVGIDLLDTAPAYGGGHSEEVVGQAVAGHRDDYVVATKLNTNQITREQVREQLHGSLRRLGFDHVDVLQIHWPNSKGEPFAETIAAMHELRDEGKIRVVGVSNFTAEQLAECLQTGRVDSLQPPYNLLWRHVERSTQPFCVEHGIGMIPYSPLAQGLLSGKYDRANRPADRTRPRNLLWHGECFDIALRVVDELRAIAAAHEASCAQVALAWLLHRPGVVSVLAGAKRPQQLRDNAGAADIHLTDDEVQRLAAAGDPLTDLTKDEPKMWFTGTAGDYDIR